MTATVMITNDQRQVLKMFAGGRDAAFCAEALRLGRDLVDAAVALAGGDPARAGELVDEPVDAAAVRRWANENGVACNSHGRVPARVIEAWRAATGRAA
jgi:hypothetical protein